MLEQEAAKCSKCGVVLVPVTYDDSFSYDGNIDCSGMVCPECTKTNNANIQQK